MESILQEHVRACSEGALVRREGGVDLRRQHDSALVWQLGARENILPRRRRPSGMARLQVDEDDEPVQLRLQRREEPEGSRLAGQLVVVGGVGRFAAGGAALTCFICHAPK